MDVQYVACICNPLHMRNYGSHAALRNRDHSCVLVPSFSISISRGRRDNETRLFIRTSCASQVLARIHDLIKLRTVNIHLSLTTDWVSPSVLLRQTAFSLSNPGDLWTLLHTAHITHTEMVHNASFFLGPEPPCEPRTLESIRIDATISHQVALVNTRTSLKSAGSSTGSPRPKA